MFHPSFGFLTLLFPLSFVSQRSSLSGELPLVEVTLSGLRSQSLTDKKDGVPSDKWRSESGSSASLFCYTFLQSKTFWFSPENLKVSIQQSTWATSGKNCPGPRYQTYTNCQVIVNPIILKCWAKSQWSGTRSPTKMLHIEGEIRVYSPRKLSEDDICHICYSISDPLTHIMGHWWGKTRGKTQWRVLGSGDLVLGWD